MKKNGFYLLPGIAAIVLVSFFWYSGAYDRALLMELTCIAAGAIVSYVKVNCSDFTEDERDIILAGQARRRTMPVFWVFFYAVLIKGMMHLFHAPSFVYPPPPPIETVSKCSPRSRGFLQPGLLSDDLSVRRIPIIVCPKMWGLGD
jgi:uncharacterized membrane protein